MKAICAIGLCALLAAPVLGQETKDPTRLGQPAWVAKSMGQVFFRGSYARLTDARDSEVFTDTEGALGLRNDDQDGWAAGAGLDLRLADDMWPSADVLGEVFVEYAEFSREEVIQPTSALLGAARTTDLTVSQLSVVIAPKVRVDIGDARLRLWVIPVGMAFLVNSPPSNDTTYLDIGTHHGIGADYLLFDPFRVGIDFRYTQGFGRSDTHTDYFSAGVYLGIDF